MGISILFTEGQRGQLFKMNEPKVLVGRKHGEIKLSDPRCSKVHALLYTNQGKLWVKDLGSRNGVYVNDERSMKAELKEGDRFKIGETLFKVQEVNIAKPKEDESAGHLILEKPEPGSSTIELEINETGSTGIKTPEEGYSFWPLLNELAFS